MRFKDRTARRSALVRIVLVCGFLGALALSASTSATAAGTSTINTSVVTKVPNFEFNAYFGEGRAQISCELDVHLTSAGSKPINEAYCMSYTAKLVHNVRLAPSGIVKICVGASCGSNAGDGTPDFSPGTRVRSGPFTCVVEARAVRCVVASGRGFVIDTASITKVDRP